MGRVMIHDCGEMRGYHNECDCRYLDSDDDHSGCDDLYWHWQYCYCYYHWEKRFDCGKRQWRVGRVP